MNQDQNIQELPVLRPNSACPSKLQQQSAEIIRTPDILETDLPCNKNTVGDIPDTNYLYTESDKRDVHLQTRKDMHTVTERPYSLDKMAPSSGADVGSCPDYAKPSESPCTYSKQSMCARNPITGSGLNGDGVGGLKPKKLKNREGNPVTGEGYKPGATDYNQPASLNGSNQVINKNRVPPGGYSSGLW